VTEHFVYAAAETDHRGEAGPERAASAPAPSASGGAARGVPGEPEGDPGRGEAAESDLSLAPNIDDRAEAQRDADSGEQVRRGLVEGDGNTVRRAEGALEEAP